MSEINKATPTTKEDAARIQSDAAKKDHNAEFAARAQAAADKNAGKSIIDNTTKK